MPRFRRAHPVRPGLANRACRISVQRSGKFSFFQISFLETLRKPARMQRASYDSGRGLQSEAGHDPQDRPVDLMLGI